MSTFSDIALKMSCNDAVASSYPELYFQDFARQTIIVPQANKQKKGTVPAQSLCSSILWSIQ